MMETQTIPLIEFNQATVIRGDNKALDAISLKIDPGENVAIIGPNGSGKSTLIKTITRECYPLARKEGAPVKIFGEHIWNVEELRSYLGIVSADLQRICERGFTGEEMIVSSFFGSIGLLPNHPVTEKMAHRTKELLEFLEITHLADKPMNEMSTGEARRIVIARALVHRPKALMLDEPCNGLDPHAAWRFRSTMRKIARAGRSIIMVTHHLEDIIPEINRVILIRDGKVFRDGNKVDILTEPNLSELFHMPVEIQTRNDSYYLWTR